MKPFENNSVNVTFGSHSFFGQDLMPSIENVSRRRICGSTPYEQRDALEYLYVYGGRGVIEINGIRHALQRGSCLVLSSYQLCRFSAENAHPLEINDCRLKDGSVYVFWSCPYYQQPDFRTSVEKTSQIQQFDERQMEQIEALWNQIYNCHFSTDRLAKEQQLYLFMEYLGYFHRLCYRK